MGLHVKCPVLNKSGFAKQIFMTVTNTKFHGKPRWYTRTDRYEVKRRFRRLCERA